MLTVKRADFLKVANVVAMVPERGKTIPILKCVKLAAVAAGLAITANDLDRELTGRVAAEGGMTECVVPAVRLFASVRAMSGETVTFDNLKDGRLEIANGDRTTVLRVMTMAVADFPEMGAPAEATFRVTLAEGALQGLLAPVAFCISTEETRYYLNGICLETGPMLRAIATDGHRLSLRDMTLPDGSWSGAGDARPILHHAAVAVMLAMPRDAEATLSIHGGARGLVEVGPFRMSFKLIDGTFPDYRRVIPADAPHCLTLNPAALSRTIKTLTAGQAERACMTIVPAGERIGLRIKGAEDEALAVMAAKVEGSPVAIGVNPRYLRDVALSFGTLQVSMSITDAGSPMVFRSEGVAGLAVLMPMRGDGANGWTPGETAA